MSALPHPEIAVQVLRPPGLSRTQFASLSTLLSILGLATIWPTMLSLQALWATDPLKSIGMVVPLVSLALILRVWRTLCWQADGTWWGLAPMLIAMAAAQLPRHAILILVVSPHWSAVLPPPSLILLAYGSGAVLFFGGVTLYRAALFPILLLWFANPVPHAFSLLVDLPLQQASAYIARTLAMHLGQPLTPDHLRLMFTPDFGMFIAPGCNGIRGALTMGFIAAIAGYVYRFRWVTNALVVIAAIALGYAFNLLRLCLLVLYYLLALHRPSLQERAENADYVIGALLFLLGTLLLFGAIHRLRDADGATLAEATFVPDREEFSGVQTTPQTHAQLAVMAAMVLVACAGIAQASTEVRPGTATAESATQRFPARLGSYTLVRSWNETELTGKIIYVWAEYAPAGQGTSIAIGLSNLLGWHDPLICHSVRGEHPLWQGPLAVATAGSAITSFSSAFYRDGTTQYLEASTQCGAGPCGEFATERTHFGFVYSRPDPDALFRDASRQPIPILLRAGTLDTAMPADAARQMLTGDLRAFLASVSLDELARPTSR